MPHGNISGVVSCGKHKTSYLLKKDVDLNNINCINCQRTNDFKKRVSRYISYRKLTDIIYKEATANIDKKTMVINGVKLFLITDLRTNYNRTIANHVWAEIPNLKDRRKYYRSENIKFNAVRREYNKKETMAKRYSLVITEIY